MRQSLPAIPAEDAVNWLSVLTSPSALLCAAEVGGACVLQPLWTNILRGQIRENQWDNTSRWQNEPTWESSDRQPRCFMWEHAGARSRSNPELFTAHLFQRVKLCQRGITLCHRWLYNTLKHFKVLCSISFMWYFAGNLIKNTKHDTLKVAVMFNRLNKRQMFDFVRSNGIIWIEMKGGGGFTIILYYFYYGKLNMTKKRASALTDSKGEKKKNTFKFTKHLLS